jgi:hypothetical protein
LVSIRHVIACELINRTQLAEILLMKASKDQLDELSHNMSQVEGNLMEKLELEIKRQDAVVLQHARTMDTKIVKIRNETNMDTFLLLINKKADQGETQDKLA